MTDADRQLDDDLRRVPLPESLRAALTPEALFTDAAIDRLVASVSVPPGLAARVRAAAHAGDAAARNGIVDLTRFSAAGGAPRRLELPGADVSVRRRRGGLTILREAGRVAAALGLAFLLATAGVGTSRWLEYGAPGIPPKQTAGTRGAPSARRVMPNRPDASGSTTQTAAAEKFGAEPSVDPPGSSDPERVVAVGDEESRMTDDTADSPLATVAASPAPLRVRGAAVPFGDEPAAMTVVELPRDARRHVPTSAAFDLAFEMAHGESPFVNPAADSSLAIDHPPLTLATDGLERLLWAEADRRGRTPRIRAEEILAAMPPPPDLAGPASEPMRLGINAVRSGRTLNGMPTMFLEVAALAVGDRRHNAAPLRATLILDQAAAGDSRAWPRICRGVEAVASRLGPADRISVVLCGRQPRVAVRDADPATLAAAAANWEVLPAVVSSDLDAAVEAARKAGLMDGRTVVVAHGATLDRCRGDVPQLLASWHAALAQTGGDPRAAVPADVMRFLVLDPATPAPSAAAEATFGRTSLDAVAIRRDLLREVLGEDTLVAGQCSLEVRFDPRRVAAYRLVGHRQTVVESLAKSTPSPLDLHAGETVRAVYEVVPRTAGATELATARLTWRTPQGSSAALEALDRDSDDRQASLPSPHGCELFLAATLGDLAGGSAHVSQPRTAVAALTSVAERWQVRGDVTPFGAALLRAIDRQADSLHGGR